MLYSFPVGFRFKLGFTFLLGGARFGVLLVMANPFTFGLLNCGLLGCELLGCGLLGCALGMPGKNGRSKFERFEKSIFGRGIALSTSATPLNV